MMFIVETGNRNPHVNKYDLWHSAKIADDIWNAKTTNVLLDIMINAWEGIVLMWALSPTLFLLPGLSVKTFSKYFWEFIAWILRILINTKSQLCLRSYNFA